MLLADGREAAYGVAVLRVDVLLLALLVLALAATGAARAATAGGRSIRSTEPLEGWSLRLFTGCVFLMLPGMVLLFIAVLPWLRAVADAP